MQIYGAWDGRKPRYPPGVGRGVAPGKAVAPCGLGIDVVRVLVIIEGVVDPSPLRPLPPKQRAQPVGDAGAVARRLGFWIAGFFCIDPGKPIRNQPGRCHIPQVPQELRLH